MSKIAILGLFLVIFSNSILQAQAEFMPVGAELHITISAYGEGGELTFLSEKDTLYSGNLCRKITQIDEKGNKISYFAKQIKDSIFYWNKENTQFDFAFRTNMNVGDTLTFGDIGDKTQLIAYSVQEINSIRLTYCRLQCLDTKSNNYIRTKEIVIYDRLGFAEFYNGYFGSCFNIHLSDIPKYLLNCYRDKQISFSINSKACTFGNAEINVDKIAIYPNPTQNTVNITAGENVLIRQCELIDALGHTVQKLHFDDVTSVFYQFSNIHSGTYLLKIETSTGDIVRKKIIIHH